MAIINLKSFENKSFISGFWKGLAAPAMMFEKINLPKNEFNPIPTPTIKDTEALRNDWKAIGNDLYKVIERHDKKITSTQTKR